MRDVVSYVAYNWCVFLNAEYYFVLFYVNGNIFYTLD